ncbi:MAG TPA: hypothetical protein VNK05_08580 [Chloroflexota bacterium]|nr:hypothetical protein [Chloroflexota bacterium]
MEDNSGQVSQIGPIQLVVIGFPKEAQFRGEIIRSLTDLRGRGVIRLIDALFVRKDDQGQVSAAMRESDLTTEQRATMGALTGMLMGVAAGGTETGVAMAESAAQAVAQGAFGLGLADLQNVQDSLEPGTAALLLLIEHTWAAALKGAVRGAGGVPLMQGFLTPEALMLVGAEVRAVVEAETTIALADAVKGAAILDALATVEAAEAVKQAAAAEAARALIAAGLIEEAAAQEAIEVLVAAELIEEGAAAEARAAVEQAEAVIQEARAAQGEAGGEAAGAAPEASSDPAPVSAPTRESPAP